MEKVIKKGVSLLHQNNGKPIKNKDMKTTTVQDVLLRNFKDAQTMFEKMAITDAIAADIINTDPALVSADKEWRNRGLWRVGLWLNEYHFGKELTEYLKKYVFTYTHDEDRVFTVEDLREEIKIRVYIFADNWDFDKEEEEEEE